MLERGMNWIPIASTAPSVGKLHAFDETEASVRGGSRAACGFTMETTDQVSSIFVDEYSEETPVCRACAALHPSPEPHTYGVRKVAPH
jgi:hypothetical protein